VSVRIEYRADELTIEPGPAFLPADADRTCELLAQLEPGASVAIDLRNVRDCPDAAFCRLVLALRDAQAKIALRGISQHQERLLRYLEPDRGGSARAS
jgi:hypothetical protein